MRPRMFSMRAQGWTRKRSEPSRLGQTKRNTSVFALDQNVRAPSQTRRCPLKQQERGQSDPRLSDGTLRKSGREQHLVSALVADVELRPDPGEMDAERIRRHAKAVREGRAVETLSLAGEQLHLAEDAELAPREANRPQVERRLVESGRTDGRRVVRFRAPQGGVGVRADLPGELARRGIAFGRAPEPRCDLA